MTNTTPETTPTRDEAGPFCLYCANRRTYERDDGAIFPCKHCKPTHAMMMASGPETRAYALASAPAPASCGVDAVAVELLRPFAEAAAQMFHRKDESTVFGQPALGIGRIALVEDFVRARVYLDQLDTEAALSPAATTVSEAEPVLPDPEHVPAPEVLVKQIGYVQAHHNLPEEVRALLNNCMWSLAKPASSPAGGDVDWKSLFETAHGALICIAEVQADAHYARKVAEELTDATLSQSTSAGKSK